MFSQTSLKKLKAANKKFKYTIFGYIHKHEQIQSITIPLLINYICLNYYLLNEKFTKHGEQIELNPFYNTIKLKNCTNNTAYGDLIINDTDESVNEYQWHFKADLLGWIGVGIDSSNKQYINDDFTNPDVNKSLFYACILNPIRKEAYLYNTYGLGNSKLNIEFFEHFKMILNQKNKKLKFEFNDEKLTIYHPNINFNNIQYHMAIALSQSQGFVKLTKFIMKQN